VTHAKGAIETMMGLCLKTSLLIMGLSGIIAQIILLRELLVSFQGNELTIGIILANWLVLEAFGSFFIGKTVERTVRKMETFVLLQLIFSLAFPLALYLSRIFKNMLPTTPGEGLGLGPIFYSSFLILLPVAIPHGALFTYGSKLYAQSFREEVASIGKVYVLETIGTILGGLGITYLLIPYLNSFGIAFLLSFINSLISAFLLWPGRKLLSFTVRTTLFGFSFLLSLVYAIVLFSPMAGQIHGSSIQSQWEKMGVIHNETSIYGNITVTKKGEQFTFFTNGVPSITVPVPDIAFIEDLIHFPMLLHEKPDSILILGGGAGGMIHEILKHPVARIDYAELDPLLLKLVRQYATPLTQSELSNPKVTIHDADGRFFILKTSKRFDVVFIGVPAPQDLQANRLFSSEFFSFVKQKMNPHAILVLFLPGSITHMSKEVRDLNACILDTLKTVFPYVKIIPGDINFYLASTSKEVATVTTEEMDRRLKARHVETKLISRSYLDDRLQEQWIEWYSRSMREARTHINSDFRPLGIFYGLSYWNALFSPYLTGIFQRFEKLTFKSILMTLTVFSFLVLLLFTRKPRISIQSIPYAIFTTGLTGMIFNLSIIFAFQTCYGYLYREIGILVAVFMTGIALGSLVMTAHLKRTKRESLLFLETEFGLILFSLLLSMVFFVLAPLQRSATVLFEALFWVTSFVSGVLMGLQFPLATKIYLHALPAEATIGRAAGLIYGVDLLGGFVGGLFGGILLLPVLGLKQTSFLMAMIKMSSLLSFLAFIWIRQKERYPL
jgi:spermidine synthase